MKTVASSNVKYTAVLPDHQIKELKRLAAVKVIPSVNYGIREAIEQYITQTRKEEYERLMIQAASDKSFMKRTLETQNEFEDLDSEGLSRW